MDVTKLLEADHRDAEDLLQKIHDADPAERPALIDELASSLEAHMELEEQVFYPKAEPVIGEESVQEGDTEHDLARKALKDVVALAPDEPGFGAALDVLKAGLEHHVEDEETEMFPELRKEGTVLEKVATPFMQKRMELGLPMDGPALAEASTKEELLEEAKSAGIEGAASMNKAELADALAAAMAGG